MPIQPLSETPTERFHVRDYGAAGDGSTDDSTAIQAAITAAEVAGGEVFFPRATYRVGTTIVADTADVTLRFENATLDTAGTNTLLRIGSTSSTAATAHRIHVIGQLTLKGSDGATGDGLVVRNVSYCRFERIKIQDCGGISLLLTAFERGCQYNHFDNLEITSNPTGDNWVLESVGSGGYVNDNAFTAVRCHSNTEGTLTHMRISALSGSSGVTENAFYRCSVESNTGTDTLITAVGNGTLALVENNQWYGLRLDGTTGTNTLVLGADCFANQFYGITFDGDTPTDVEATSMLFGNTGSGNLPYIRLGDASATADSGFEMAIRKPGTVNELHLVALDGAGSVRFPAGTKALVGDRNGGDNGPVELEATRIGLRTLSGVATGSGPDIKFEGEFGATDEGNVVIEQLASLDGGTTGRLQIGGDFVTSGLTNGRTMSTDGTKLDAIEASATADQTGAEIKTAYEAESDTNAFTDSQVTDVANNKTHAASSHADVDATKEYFSTFWAEENAVLSAATYEWAYGNGAATPLGSGIIAHVPSGYSAEIVALGISFGGTSTATVEAVINNTPQGSSAQVVCTAARSAINSGYTAAVSDGYVINFRTLTVSGTTISPAIVSMTLRFYK